LVLAGGRIDDVVVDLNFFIIELFPLFCGGLCLLIPPLPPDPEFPLVPVDVLVADYLFSESGL
jgi:hypothetical protein